MTNLTLGHLNALEKSVFEKLDAALKYKKAGVKMSTIHENVMKKMLPKVKLASWNKIA